jgi:hypothetical protein
LTIGRPTEYQEAFCEAVIRMGEEGYSVVEMAAELGVHRDSLYEWEKVHPIFSDAFTRARQLTQAWWERQGRVNLATQGFNASLWAKNMGCRFKGDWTEKTQTELTGADGKDLIPSTIVFQPVAPRDPDVHG